MKKFLLSLIGIAFALCAFNIPLKTVKADDVVIIGDLTVHFIDVGQGDSCFIELPDGRTMLIDAGKKEYGKTVESYINENIKDDNGNAISFIDFVIFTHSDADHIGGMSYVLGKFDAGIVYRSNEECKFSKNGVTCSDSALSGKENRNRFWGDKHGEKTTIAYHEAIERAYEVADEVIVTNPSDDSQNEIVSTSEKYYTINFYSPLSPRYTDLNNHSPIIVIEYRGRRIVLSGDAEEQNEAEFVQKVKEGEGRYSVFDSGFCADVIKLGHHGSKTSSSKDYLGIMTNQSGRKSTLVVISCGKGNTYGHPHEEVLERLLEMGFNEDRILRTDLLGDVVVTIAEQDGIYRAIYAKGGLTSDGNSGGSGEGPGGGSDDPGEDDLIGSIIDKFNSFDLVTKILIIAAIVAVVVLVIVVWVAFSKSSKRKKQGRRR